MSSVTSNLVANFLPTFPRPPQILIRNEICNPRVPSSCFYSGDISEPVAKQIRAFVERTRTTRLNTGAVQWRKGHVEKGRKDTDTVYPLWSSVAPMLLHAKNLQSRQWRSYPSRSTRNTTGTSCILAPIARGKGTVHPRLKYNRSLKYVWGMLKFMPPFRRIYASVCVCGGYVQ